MTYWVSDPSCGTISKYDLFCCWEIKGRERKRKKKESRNLGNTHLKGENILTSLWFPRNLRTRKYRFSRQPNEKKEKLKRVQEKRITRMAISCRQDEGEEWWALIWNGRKISCDVRGNQKRIMQVWSLVPSEKWISKGKWRFYPRIWRSWSSKYGCLMILSHYRWIAMGNIALWW